MSLRRAFLLVFALAAFTGAAPVLAQDQIYQAINRLRASVCGSPLLDPLKADPRLEQAASALARGGEVAEIVRRAGYRANRAFLLHIPRAGNDWELLSLIAKNYCPRLADRDIVDIGMKREGTATFIVIAAPFAPRVSESQLGAGQRLLELVNEARRRTRWCGSASFKEAPPLRWNQLLAIASQQHAEDMAAHNFVGPQGLDGSTPAQRAERTGYRSDNVGLTIAAGPTRAEEAIAGWLKSAQPCAAIMNPAFTDMGGAYAIDSRTEFGVYWVQTFGGQSIAPNREAVPNRPKPRF